MSDEINQDVTTPTNTDGNYHSFDDLEQSLGDTRSDAELVQEAKEVASEESTPATKEDIKEALSESNKEEAVSTKTPEENANDAGDTAAEEIIEEIKKLKAKYGEEELEIPQDATFAVKIDGEEMDVSLNDLRTNYSGKVAWDKRFTELSKEKTEYIQDKQMVESYIQQFSDHVSKGDNLGAMEFLAQLAGQNPLEFRKQLRDQVIENHKALMEMDDTQKKAYELNEENEFLKRQQESAQELSAEQQTVQELQTQITSFQEAQNVSDQELLAAYDDLQANYDGEIDINTIQEYVSTSRAYQKTEEALSSVVTELNDDVLVEVAEVVIENPDFTKEDIIDIVSEAYPDLINSKSKKGVSKKAQQSAKKASESSSESPSERLERNKLEEFFSFDEL